MKNSVLVGSSPNRHSLSIRAAIVLVTCVWMLACTGDVVTRPIPREAPVFTRVLIVTDSGRDRVRVGDSVGIQVLALDQYFVSMVPDTVYQTVNNQTLASIVFVPANKWDYGDAEFVIGSRPGRFMLTATARVGGVTRSDTLLLAILDP
jgi:hypothetical protein